MKHDIVLIQIVKGGWIVEAGPDLHKDIPGERAVYTDITALQRDLPIILGKYSTQIDASPLSEPTNEGLRSYQKRT